MHERVVHRKDIIIDLPPKIEMLKRNVAILIPFNRSFEHYRKDTCALSVFFDHYINGTVLGYSEVKRTVSVKSVYYRKLTTSFALFTKPFKPTVFLDSSLMLFLSDSRNDSVELDVVARMGERV